MGIPTHLNVVLNFAGHNSDNAVKYFPNDVGEQNLYTFLHTGIDVFAMHLFPSKKVAEGFKRLLNKDIVDIVRDLSDKKITEAVAKKTFIEKAGRVVLSLGKGNTQTANALFVFEKLHNLGDAAFGKRDFKLADELSEGVTNYKTNWLNSTFLSSFSAFGKGSNTANGKIFREIAEDSDKYRDIIINDKSLNEKDRQDRLNKIDHLEAVNQLLSTRNIKPSVREKYLNTSMKQLVAQKAVKESIDKALAKEDERKASILEVEKEHILTPMSNTKLLENLYEHLSDGDKRQLSTDGKFDENKVGGNIQ